MKQKGVLLIWDRIGDYHLARIRACEKTLDMPVYTANLGCGDALYKWDNITADNHFDLSEKAVEKKDFRTRFKRFKQILKDKQITTIALGYGRNEYLVFLLYARLKGIRTVVFCESWYARGKLTDFFKSILLRSIGDYFFVSGKRAFRHVHIHYRVSANRIYEGYSVVDNDHFNFDKSSVERANSIICVARYSTVKNLELLIRAFLQSDIKDNYSLHIIGDGPEKEKLTQLIDGKSVILYPWLSYNQLPEIYASAKIFVLPSRFEPWGLVVNEAMAAGLPLILSKECGCLPELLEENKNGESFDWNDETGLTAVFNRWNKIPDDILKQMGEYSHHKITLFSPHTWATQLKKITQI